jgi:hypothetical protein
MQKAAAERLRELEPYLRLSNLHRRSYPMKRGEDFDRLKEAFVLQGSRSEAPSLIRPKLRISSST